MKIKKIVSYFLLIFIVGIAFCAWNIFGPVINTEKKIFYIHTGANYQQVKDSLLKNKVIKGTFWFDKISNYVDYPQKVKAGKYKLKDGMSLYDLIKMLHSGRQVPVNLVITKLRTKEDLAKKISEKL